MSRQDGIIYDAAVLTADADLGEIIAILLEETGYTAAFGDGVTCPLARLLIVDLDSCGIPEIFSGRGYMQVIGITKEIEKADNASVDKIISRPFGFSEFRQAVREAIENVGRQISSENAADKTPRFEINDRERTVTANGKKIKLTPNEYRILSFMLSRRGSVVTKDELSLLLGEKAGDSNRAVVHVCAMRRKLEDLTGFNIISTVRNEGYRIKT